MERPGVRLGVKLRQTSGPRRWSARPAILAGQLRRSPGDHAKLGAKPTRCRHC